MSFLRIDDDLAEFVENAEELIAAPAGEYTVQFLGFATNEEGGIEMTNRNGGAYLRPEFEIVDHPEEENFKSFSDYIGLPNDDMKLKAKKQAAFKLNSFCKAFGIDLKNEIDPEEYIGNRAEVILSWKDDPEYGTQNGVKKFLKPA